MTKKLKGNNKSKNKDDKCFQYANTVVLNYQNIKKYCQTLNPLLISIIGKK